MAMTLKTGSGPTICSNGTGGKLTSTRASTAGEHTSRAQKEPSGRNAYHDPNENLDKP